MIKINLAKTEKHLQQIESLADTIWREHYTSIIGEEQVAYMLQKFQSVSAMNAQIKEGYDYYLVHKNETPVGYFSIQKRGKSMFLSKLYVLKLYRGQGIGKASMDYINEQAKAYGCKKITLTVNRNNENTIRAYGALGFKNVGEQMADIGEGFVMDDYILDKVL